MAKNQGWVRPAMAPGWANATWILTLVTSGFVIPQDGQGNRSVDRRHKQGLQIGVCIGESIGVAGLMHDPGINVALAVPERLIGRKLPAVVGAVRAEVPLVDADAEISEQRVGVDRRGIVAGAVGPVLP